MICHLEGAIFNLMCLHIAYDQRTIKKLPTIPHLSNCDELKLKLKAFISNKPITGTFELSKGRSVRKYEASCPFQSVVGSYGEERARNSTDTLDESFS